MIDKKKVVYDRPSKRYYLGWILWSILTLQAFVYLAKVFAYYQVNHSLGKRRAKIGSKTKIHPTALIRHGERVSIGSNCLINHNNIIQGGKSIAHVRIGNYVQTGPNVMIFAFNHGTDLSDTPMTQQDYYDEDVIIKGVSSEREASSLKTFRLTPFAEGSRATPLKADNSHAKNFITGGTYDPGNKYRQIFIQKRLSYNIVLRREILIRLLYPICSRKAAHPFLHQRPRQVLSLSA